MKIVFFRILTILPILVGFAASLRVDPVEFLFDYGYLKVNKDTRSLNPTPEQMMEAILEFQNFYNIPLTGYLDERTLEEMNSLRCGDKDIIPQGPAVFKMPKEVEVPTKTFTWRILKYSTRSGLDQDILKSALKRCLDRWSEVVPLDFQETNGEADIYISFDKKDDNDGYPFEDLSPGLISFSDHLPKGHLHFNDEVKWVIGKDRGYDLEAVATHEIGCVLGLKKSADPSAVMYAYYSKRPVNFKLHSEDIANIQAIYGKRDADGVLPTTTTSMTTTDTIARKPKTFTWKIKKYSKKSKLTQAQQKLAIRRGFQRWSEFAQLIFTETTGKADIKISFDSGYRFEIGILAYTTPNKVIHLNDNIPWVIGKRKGVALEPIAVHEIGHILGLYHSKNPSSIMYSEERHYNFKLHSEDIEKIQAIYGKKTVRVPPASIEVMEKK